MNFFRVSLCALVVAVLVGCSTPKHKLTSEEGAAIRAALSTEYGFLSSSGTTEYLVDLTAKILTAAGENNAIDLKTAPEVIILNTDEPLALTHTLDSIFISKGIISQLDSEGALAFVLAHELAHITLKHDPEEVYNQDVEISSDKEALATVLTAGYSPRSIVSALSLVRHSDLNTSEIEKRMSAIGMAMEDKENPKNGLSLSYNFHRFKQQVKLLGR